MSPAFHHDAEASSASFAWVLSSSAMKAEIIAR
jgi:hypothetical protein